MILYPFRTSTYTTISIGGDTGVVGMTWVVVVVVVVVELLCLVGADDYGGASMPQYAGRVDYADARLAGVAGHDYLDQSLDASALLDYKYEEESQGQYLLIVAVNFTPLRNVPNSNFMLFLKATQINPRRISLSRKPGEQLLEIKEGCDAIEVNYQTAPATAERMPSCSLNLDQTSGATHGTARGSRVGSRDSWWSPLAGAAHVTDAAATTMLIPWTI